MKSRTGPDDYYQTLSVAKHCTQQEIKKAYRKLALQFHPDRQNDPHKKKLATTRFQEISEAYNCLSDPAQRRAYDNDLRRGEAKKGRSVSEKNDTLRSFFSNHAAPAPPTGSAGFRGESHSFDPLNADADEMQPTDLKQEFFESNHILQDFMNWQGRCRPPRSPHPSQRATDDTTATCTPRDRRSRCGADPGVESGWAPTPGGHMLSAGERLMKEASQCFNAAPSHRGGARSQKYFERTSRTLPVPPPDASCSSGFASMGRVPIFPTHGERGVQERCAGGSTADCPSPSSNDDEEKSVDHVLPEVPRLVILTGLTSVAARQYNRKIGHVIEARLNPNDRWRVRLIGNERVFRIRSENLLRLPCGVLQRLRSKEELNGKTVILLGQASDGSGRYNCVLLQGSSAAGAHAATPPKRSRMYCVHPKKLILGPDTIVALKSEPKQYPKTLKHNKHTTQILSYSSGWYTLALSNNKRVRVRSNNIFVAFKAYAKSIAMLESSLSVRNVLRR